MERQSPDLRAVFDQALEIDTPGEREAFLAAACADAPELLQQVEGLLRAHADAGSFLHTPAPDLPTTVDRPAAEGTIVGRTGCCSRSARAGWGRSSWPSRPTRFSGGSR